MKDINLLDINKTQGFPRKYIFNSFARWFTLVMASLAIFWSFDTIFKLNQDSATFIKAVPFIVLFLAATSIMKNLFSLNSVKFEEDGVTFNYLGKKAVKLEWYKIKRMHLEDARRRAVKVTYATEHADRSVEFTLGFPNILEIINAIAEMCPEMELDEFMDKVVISRIQVKKGKSSSNNA